MERKEKVLFTTEHIAFFQKSLMDDGRQFALVVIPENLVFVPDHVKNLKKIYPELRTIDPIKYHNYLMAGLTSSIPHVLDLKSVFEEGISKSPIFFNEGLGHFNEAGHQLTAGSLYNFIVSTFLLSSSTPVGK